MSISLLVPASLMTTSAVAATTLTIDSWRTDDSKIWIISNKMSELGYFLHSGSSFGCTMRDMQYIAQNGEKKFMENYLSK